MTEDEMVVWHHQLNGHEFEQAPGVDDDREAWHAAVHGWQRVGHDSVIELTPKVLGVLHFTMGFFCLFFF